MDEMYLFKSQDEGKRLLYAYYKGEFWFYDPNVQQWCLSGHVREQYELESQKDVSLTPDDFTCTGYGYEFVAEYEVPVSVLDALRAAKKVLPPEPVSAEVPLPGRTMCTAPPRAGSCTRSVSSPTARKPAISPCGAMYRTEHGYLQIALFIPI